MLLVTLVSTGLCGLPTDPAGLDNGRNVALVGISTGVVAGLATGEIVLFSTNARGVAAVGLVIGGNALFGPVAEEVEAGVATVVLGRVVIGGGLNSVLELVEEPAGIHVRIHTTKHEVRMYVRGHTK